MTFSVLNWNIQHGRNHKTGFWPPLVTRARAQATLDSIAERISSKDADIIAVQEIDKDSFLSGYFDQVQYLNARLHYPYVFYAPSCTIAFGASVYESGTAIFSRFPLENCSSHRFGFTFPTDRMGFALADTTINNERVTIVCAHLTWIDWLHANVRKDQFIQMREALTSRAGRLIVAGDFNCDARDASLRSFMKELRLETHELDEGGNETSHAWAPYERIDWIFARDLHLNSYVTLPGILSDHLAILAKYTF
ncbi:MAG: endonuclease/exonuclease/phosphatase family protein [Candidatus Kaiserbacteria bacterium]|nr:endonuclease/exonuclease/phosphatase family protein [Candidatus Kaiserbacteria bacterium]